MVLVTDKQFYMDKRLKEKIDLLIKRCEKTTSGKKDVVLLIEGDEGEGKSNFSIQIGYYVSQETGRPFSEENIYFSLEKMIDKAKKTERQILIWDEPALEGLSNEWWKQTQRNLIKLLMMARKKRHFIMINITKFFKFPEYVVVDRAIGMIHVYSRKELQAGRFVYFKKKSKEILFYSYRSSKKRMYRKYYSFRGTFPWVLPKIINEEEYEKNKDDAIMSIGGEEDMPKWKIMLYVLRYKVSQLPLKDKEKAEGIGVSIMTIQRWKKIKQKYPSFFENEENNT